MGSGTPIPPRNSHAGFPMVKMPVEKMVDTWLAATFLVSGCLGFKDGIKQFWMDLSFVHLFAMH